MNIEEPDSLLASRAARDDSRAFDSLVKRHHAGLAQAARSFGIPATDIDDIVQETFVAAWRSLSDYDADRPFRAWLYRIALNKMRDLHRFRKVRHFLFGAFDLDDPDLGGLDDGLPGPERAVSARRELARVNATLGRLERGQREAIVLTALVGLSQVEAADAMGITPKALEGRVARARTRLAHLLASDIP